MQIQKFILNRDFKTKRENFRSNSITLIVLEKNFYLYIFKAQNSIKYDLMRSNQNVIQNYTQNFLKNPNIYYKSLYVYN